MPPSPALDSLQRWMQSAILTPETPAVAEVEARVLPSRTLTAVERLDIYRGMYELRLMDALQVDYPGLYDLLGPQKFTDLARLYIRQNPSRSYTLNRLGDQLPDFLEQVEGLPRPRLLRDLARLELAETLVFDEEQTSAATPDTLQGIAPDAWEFLQLQPIAALRLLALNYPVQRYLRPQAGDRAIPRRKATYLAVYRRDYAVMHLELTPSAFALLQALCEGKTLGEALATVRIPSSRIFECFRTWFSEGLFQTVYAR